jgi:hypothetical protein
MAKRQDDFDIFSTSVDDIDLYKREKKESVFYSPKAKDGADGTYKALIRFMPNLKNPKQPIVRKFTYWLEGPDGKGQNFDSPSTVGEKCPIQQAFYRLKNSESAADRRMAEKLKRKEQFYSLIKVIKDPQKAENEGRYFILKYGTKLKQKIDDEMSPAFDEGTQIFNPIAGKNFELIVTKQGDYNNYDTSKFQSKKSPVIVNGEPMDNSPESKAAILKELESAPDLSNFEYKAWDDQDRADVEKFLSYYSSRGASVDAIVNPKAKAQASFESKTETEFEDEDFLTEKPKAAPVSKSKPKVETKSASNDDDLDSFLDELGI